MDTGAQGGIVNSMERGKIEGKSTGIEKVILESVENRDSQTCNPPSS